MPELDDGDNDLRAAPSAGNRRIGAKRLVVATVRWSRDRDRLRISRALPVSERLLTSELRAARADERLQRAAQYPSNKAFERVERSLERAGVFLDTSEWIFYRSPGATWSTTTPSEAWVLWRPDTGEQLASLSIRSQARARKRIRRRAKPAATMSALASPGGGYVRLR